MCPAAPRFPLFPPPLNSQLADRRNNPNPHPLAHHPPTSPNQPQLVPTEVDIHPAATLGSGILLDHATGIVIGQTSVVGDNVSMLHRVVLGGSGFEIGRRHPTIGETE